MDINWIFIGIVAILGVVLIVFLIRKNQKDEKDVMDYFNDESVNFHEDEDEFNDEK